MSTYVISNELYHHGVLGMKWGVRRYQPYSIGYDAEHNGRFLGLPRPDSKAGKTNHAKAVAAKAVSDKKQAKTNYINADAARKQKMKSDLKSAKGIKNIGNRLKIKGEADADRDILKAKYKASKIKNEKRAAKKERKLYVKSMGDVGFDNPFTLHKQPRNISKSVQLYKKLKASKGTAYANSVLKSVLLRKAAAVGAGAAFAAYLKSPGGQYVMQVGQNLGQQALNKYGNKVLDGLETLYKKKQMMGG